jgi:hypothetical protein
VGELVAEVTAIPQTVKISIPIGNVDALVVWDLLHGIDIIRHAPLGAAGFPQELIQPLEFVE